MKKGTGMSDTNDEEQAPEWMTPTMKVNGSNKNPKIKKRIKLFKLKKNYTYLM